MNGRIVYLFAGSGEEGLTAAHAQAVESRGGRALSDYRDMDAEDKLVDRIAGLKWVYGDDNVQPIAGASSRVVCARCTAKITSSGGKLAGPDFLQRNGDIGKRMFTWP